MIAMIALALFTTIASAAASGHGGWTSAEFDELRSLSLAWLEPYHEIQPTASPTILAPPTSASGCSSTPG